MEIARRDEIARLWLSEVTDVKAALEGMSVGETNKDGVEETGHLDQLSSVVRERLEDIAKAG